MDVYHKLKKLDQSQLSNIYYKLNNKKITKDITRSILIHLILKPLKSKYKIVNWLGKTKAPTAATAATEATEQVARYDNCIQTCMRAALDKSLKKEGQVIGYRQDDVVFDPPEIAKGCTEDCKVVKKKYDFARRDGSGKKVNFFQFKE